MKAQALFDMTGRVALVTGAGSGLGLAFSEAMADNGARVVMVSRGAAIHQPYSFNSCWGVVITVLLRRITSVDRRPQLDAVHHPNYDTPIITT